MRWMTGWITSLALAVAASPAVSQEPVVVGAGISQTGAQAALAEQYRRGILLWQEGVNAGGGLLGRPVELRTLDDRSQAVRSREVYAALIAEHKADLLVGPYGSAATVLAAAEAERAGRVLANGAGPARVVHRRERRFVFQTTAPYSSYAHGVVELAREGGCRSLDIAARDDVAAGEMAAGALQRAKAAGMAVRGVQALGGGRLEALVRDLREDRARGWMIFGEPQDAADAAIALERARLRPQFLFASAAAQPRYVELVGREAEGTLGVLRYDPRLATPGNREFVAAYRSRWASAPGVAAAEGYAAATVLGEAVRRAATLEPGKLRETLAGLEVGTVLGSYKVDPASGEQTGIRPAVAQIVEGRPEVVWPPDLKTAEAKIPCH